MLQLLTTPRPFLSPSDAVSVHEASRPGTAKQDEGRTSISFNPFSPNAVRKSQFIPSRTSSLVSPPNKASWSSFDVPHLTKTPWELERHKRNSAKRQTQIETQLPGHLFKRLPREVYDCILEQLEQLHFRQDPSCPSCYLRDLFNLSLTSRAWDRAATIQMYRKVWVLGNEEHPKLPKLKITGASRLKLLRRTLRERKTLARFVRELHMPDFQALYQEATIEREEIVNLVASLVMACPNLERLVGFHIPYTHSFDRLSHALSTRSKLKERVWFLDDLFIEVDEEEDNDPTQGYYHAACDPTERFLELNSNHPTLTTLVLHQNAFQASTELTFRAIIGTLRQFPALRHLSISGLASTSFSNLALNALPPNLQSLRLENLPGVNDKGLQRFGASDSALSLRSIALINLEIARVTTIANFLSQRLEHLKRFSFAQHKAPSIPPGADTPVLQSPTLQFIHWELRSQAGPPPTLIAPFAAADHASFPFLNDEPISCLATCLLATSISKALFPSLHRIRAPHDPQGVLQSLCRPLATALLPSDNTFFTAPTRPAYPPSPSISLDSSREDSAMNSPVSGYFLYNENSDKQHIRTPMTTALTPARSRLAAQSRILAARKQPFIAVKVHDPKGALRVDKAINGFLGDHTSRITYDLRQDRQRWDENCRDVEDEDELLNGWMTGIEDVMGEWEPVGVMGYGGCRHVASGKVGRQAVLAEEMFW